MNPIQRTEKSNPGLDGEARNDLTHRPGSDLPFYIALVVLAGTYVLLVVAMLVADLKRKRAAICLIQWPGFPED